MAASQRRLETLLGHLKGKQSEIVFEQTSGRATGGGMLIVNPCIQFIRVVLSQSFLPVLDYRVDGVCNHASGVYIMSIILSLVVSASSRIST